MTHQPRAADGTPLSDLDELTPVLKALGLPIRLRIVLRLAGGECNVSTLKGLLNVPQPEVSHHLGILRGANLVETRRVSRQVFYRLGGSAAARGEEVTIDVGGSRIRVSRSPTPASAPPTPASYPAENPETE
jgi:ArsR family transcriptional regulator